MISPHKGQERNCFKTRVGTHIFFSHPHHTYAKTHVSQGLRKSRRKVPPTPPPPPAIFQVHQFFAPPPTPAPAAPILFPNWLSEKRRGIGSDLARRPRPAPAPALPHIIAQKLGRAREKNVWEIGSFWENVAKEDSLALMKIQGEMLLPIEKVFFG